MREQHLQHNRSESGVYHYAIRFMNRQVNINSAEPPAQFLEHVQQLHDLFALPQLEGFQIWVENGTWIPLKGVVEESTKLLSPDIVEDVVAEEDNRYELGKLLTERYMDWTAEVKKIMNNGVRRASDPSRLRNLHRKINTVEQGVRVLRTNEVGTEAVFDVFKLLMNPDVKHPEGMMHVSRATVFRYKKKIREQLGRWALESLSCEQLGELVVRHPHS